MRQRRGFVLQGLDEVIQRLLCPFSPDLHPPGRVSHPARYLSTQREAIYEGPEPDPLNDALDADQHSTPGGHAHSCFSALARLNNHANHGSSPSPVLQDSGKVLNPGFSISTPALK